jgi:hypothetical protein
LSVNEEKTNEISEKKERWNHKINEVFAIVKSVNWGITDDKQTCKNRWIATHLINKISKVNVVISWKYTRQTYLKAILTLVLEDHYQSHLVASVTSIHMNFAKLVKIANQVYIKEKTWGVADLSAL